jgi:hypothetical protein
MSCVAAPGATSRASTKVCLPLFASCSSQNAPPPIPEEKGSTTASAALMATEASKALPPAARMS